MSLKKFAIAVAIVLAVFVLINLGLHFGQKSHDRLNYSVNQAFPPDKPFVAGEIYATTLAAIMENELDRGFGWRPNDFFLWGMHVMADNNANRQLGIIMAVRETTRVFKDHLTKVSSNEYDPNLVIADTDFRNDAQKWMLPSAESKYRDAVQHLHMYVAGLHATPETSRELNQRNVELVRLLQSWGDMLGDAHANLYRTRKDDGSAVHSWEVDDYFYHAQGCAHVMYHMMQAVKREYHQSLTTKPVLAQLFDETIDALGKAAVLKPLIVLDGSPDGIFANHRRNLDTYISEARQKLYSIREELER
ncbi:MAG TPA: DUF2333 family protein [Candidatus Binataceae bacterium]|jgi:hypothetical protein|nr:DUF2333 family protein [Candidatus Binataceae bacterium]